MNYANMTREEASHMAQQILETLGWASPALAHHLAVHRAQIVGYYEQDMRDKFFKAPETGMGDG